MRWKKSKKNSAVWVLVIGAFAIFAWFEGSLFGNFDKFNNKTEISSSISDVNIGGVFNLIDHTGKRVTEASFPGRYKLVFFGYTWCPDICPTELLVILLRSAKKQLCSFHWNPGFPLYGFHNRNNPKCPLLSPLLHLQNS